MIHICNGVLENSRLNEITGSEHLILVPACIDLSYITSIRQSINNDGDLEDYTVLYTDMGTTLCIDTPYAEFLDIFIKSKQ
jgi:hypothetical protein